MNGNLSLDCSGPLNTTLKNGISVMGRGSEALVLGQVCGYKFLIILSTYVGPESGTITLAHLEGEVWSYAALGHTHLQYAR